MKEPKFKIGDRVKNVWHKYEGIVKFINLGPMTKQYIYVLDNGEDGYEEHFELVSKLSEVLE